jgi:hypothetical protein
MMKKRIFILTLILLFFTSTTGLPIVLHYCEMMESVSLEVCEMHKQVDIKTSCCEKENDEVRLSNGYDSCCSTKLVDSSVKDNFIISKPDLVSKTQLSIVLFLNQNIDFSFYSSYKFNTDTSPPLQPDNHIYLTNSVLLI